MVQQDALRNESYLPELPLVTLEISDLVKRKKHLDTFGNQSYNYKTDNYDKGYKLTKKPNDQVLLFRNL